MIASPQDVQTKLDQAVGYLKTTDISYKGMVRNHGSDWTKWPPTSGWYLALSKIAAARVEVGSLTVKVLAAGFSYKES